MAATGLTGLALSLLLHPDRTPSRPVYLVASGANGAASVEPAWTPIPDATPLSALAGADPDLNLTGYRARQALETGAREDSAVFGSFAEGPFLSLTLSRAEAIRSASHFVEIARRAAEAGLSVVRLGQPLPLPARFEGLEAAELQLSNGMVTRGCLSFRVRQAELGFSLLGWSCPDGPSETARQALVCQLDSLALVGGNGDLALRAAFAQAAPTNNPACAGSAEPHPATAQLVPAPSSKRARKSEPRRARVSLLTNRLGSF